MANFTTVVPHADHTEEFAARFPNSSTKAVTTEEEAIEVASELFQGQNAWNDDETREHLEHWLTPDELDAYEIVNPETDTIIGWEVDSI